MKSQRSRHCKIQHDMFYICDYCEKIFINLGLLAEHVEECEEKKLVEEVALMEKKLVDEIELLKKELKEKDKKLLTYARLLKSILASE